MEINRKINHAAVQRPAGTTDASALNEVPSKKIPASIGMPLTGETFDWSLDDDTEDREPTVLLNFSIIVYLFPTPRGLTKLHSTVRGRETQIKV